MHKKKSAPLAPWPQHHYLSNPGGGGGWGVSHTRTGPGRPPVHPALDAAAAPVACVLPPPVSWPLGPSLRKESARNMSCAATDVPTQAPGIFVGTAGAPLRSSLKLLERVLAWRACDRHIGKFTLPLAN